MDNGTTSFLVSDGEANLATPCSSSSTFTRGVWYKLEGDGRCYTASTQGSAFDTVLAVYDTTTGCEALSCVAESDEFDFYSTSQASWATTVGMDYYILLAGFFDQTGNYTVSIMVRADRVAVWFDCTNCLTFSLLSFSVVSR